jgi:hypothetical protein
VLKFERSSEQGEHKKVEINTLLVAGLDLWRWSACEWGAGCFLPPTVATDSTSCSTEQTYSTGSTSNSTQRSIIGTHEKYQQLSK